MIEPEDVLRIFLDAIVERARCHVVPLLADRARLRLQFVGSGTLLERGSGRFLLLTAGHVLDEIHPDPLFTLGSEAAGLIRLPYAETAKTSQPSGLRRRLDPVDLAAFAVSTSVAERLMGRGSRFFPEAMLSPRAHDRSALYAFVGFPRSQNRVGRAVSASGRPVPKIENTVAFAPGYGVSLETYAKAKADPRFALVAEYRHSDQLCEHDPRKPMPAPPGMSGGAAFCLGRSRDATRVLREMTLAGIGTEYHAKAGLLVAANAPAIRHLIAAF